MPISSAARTLRGLPQVYLWCMSGNHSRVIDRDGFLGATQTWTHCVGISVGTPNLLNSGGRMLLGMVLKNFVNLSPLHRMGWLQHVRALLELEFIPHVQPSRPGSEPWTEGGAILLMLGIPVGTKLWSVCARLAHMVIGLVCNVDHAPSFLVGRTIRAKFIGSATWSALLE